MAHIKGERAFLPVNIAVMTVSDTRRPEDDKSGQVLADRIVEVVVDSASQASDHQPVLMVLQD